MATATDTTTALASLQTLEDLLVALGGIAPDRVRLHPSPGKATEADLIAVNESESGICELVDGVLVEKGMGLSESLLAGIIIAALRGHVIPRNLGIVTAPDGMLRLGPGQVRVPDVAFVSWGRIPDGRLKAVAIGPFAPDLAVEILSASNTKAEMIRKRREYFRAGVHLVWEVDPRSRTVTVYDGPERSTLLDASQSLDGGEVLPGFALPVSEIFVELDRQAP